MKTNFPQFFAGFDIPTLNARVIGVLVHGKKTKAYAFIVTDFGSETNINIQCLYRVLKDIPDSERPQNLYVQLDNTRKDNKNNKFFGFLACLADKGVFKTIYINFSPVGHTHEDIDQFFQKSPQF